MVSSMPLHLLYNSVVFTNLQANSYVVVPTMESWLSGGSYDFSNFLAFEGDWKNMSSFDSTLDDYRPSLNETIILNDGTEIPRYKNTSSEPCFHGFDTQYTSEFGNVYIAQAQPTTWRNQTHWHLGVHNTTGAYAWYVDDRDNATVAWYNATIRDVASTMPFRSDPSVYPSNRWRCLHLKDSTCDFSNVTENWKPYESPVQYCMIEQVAEMCKLQFSFLIVSIVLVSNLLKAGCMSRLLLCHSSHDALVTLGDAIASFLERPDAHTEGRCLPSEVQIDRAFNGRTSVAPRNDIVRYHTRHDKELRNQARAFKPEKIRWSAASSHGTWLTAYVFYLCAVIIGLAAIRMSLHGMPKSPAQLWKIGFGSVDGRNLLTANMSLLSAVILANSPQAILSYLYPTFNRLYSSMLLGKEWSSYLNDRKTLRVTTPIGQQRSTYWLSVPYRYAIPMIIVSGLFHWLASQSLFMVQITVTRTRESGAREIVQNEQISTCGFSPFAIILTTVTATVIALCGVAMGRLTYPAGMPLASSCSAVMSAACHSVVGDENAHMLPVQWGAVTHGLNDDERVHMQTGHCTFSSLPVETPIPGRLYA
ncbi:hypothetical protein C7974DRAFT_436662 [Boeremia exigua]|uniref:uncharacterized protein n=1 Tax=Boeremia exigua TaxID=749465 RepID=UPI001E8EBE09|nr:uncharacterized protein C7974DRAFT_436662 [Boeremia exigua]KAH6616712.1 hypothetical protein C7974DRAFT_436662 [Boeremia exigua]